MSIQAGWNSALYQLGLIGGIEGAKKEVGKVGEQVSGVSQEMTAERLAQTSAERSRQALDPDFVGPLTAGQATQRQGEILRNRARQGRQWMNGEFVGPLTAHQQSRMDPNFFSRRQGFTTVGRNATQRAQEAAQEADLAPKNTIQGAMDAIKKINENRNKTILGGGN